MTDWLGNGPNRDPRMESKQARSVYCDRECICQHCNVYSKLLVTQRCRADLFFTTMWLMFVLGLGTAAFAFAVGISVR